MVRSFPSHPISYPISHLISRLPIRLFVCSGRGRHFSSHFPQHFTLFPCPVPCFPSSSSWLLLLGCCNTTILQQFFFRTLLVKLFVVPARLFHSIYIFFFILSVPFCGMWTGLCSCIVSKTFSPVSRPFRNVFSCHLRRTAKPNSLFSQPASLRISDSAIPSLPSAMPECRS